MLTLSAVPAHVAGRQQKAAASRNQSHRFLAPLSPTNTNTTLTHSLSHTHLAEQHVLERGHCARVVQRRQLLKGLEEVGVGGGVVALLWAAGGGGRVDCVWVWV